MVLEYGADGENALAATRLYQERWPQCHPPCANTILQCIQRLRDTGSVIPRGEGQQVNLNVEDAVLENLDEDPTTNTRRLAQQVGTSSRIVHCILSRHLLHPYHLQPVQQILLPDCDQRMRFCRWFLRQCVNQVRPAYVCVTDEATFTLDEVNFHNMHIWTHENNHSIRGIHFQHRFSVNVWAGIMGNVLVGPYFFEGRLNGPTYADIWSTYRLPELLDDVALQVRARMFYLQDGAPPTQYSRSNDTFE